MIEIAENDVVRQDGCSSTVSFKPSGDQTTSPQPSLDTLSLATSSMSCTPSNSNMNSNMNLNNYISSSEFNDCSSSVSSQDSSNINIAGRSININITPKRSVFSKYWQKTGQKPTPLKPVKNLSPSDIDIDDAPTSSTATWQVLSSPLHIPFDQHLLQSVSSADLLEDDHDGNDDALQQHALEQPTRAQQQGLQQQQQDQYSTPRRRSILPRAPISQPALKATVKTQKLTRSSWTKSASLTNVAEQYSLYGNNSAITCTTPKTRSLPRMRGSSSLLQPGPSCLRPYQRYSPSNADSRKSPRLSSSASFSMPSSPLLPMMLPTTTTTMMVSQKSVSSLSFSPSPSRGQLSRCGSSSTVSSVSFLEAVDVRHFEPPRETYAGKGWSDYFK